MKSLAVAILFVIAGQLEVPAQGVQVQQPVVERLSAGTMLSVPDRGTAIVGGVSRVASSTATYGPLPFGSNVARRLSSSRIESSVFIHDFQLMDQQLLAMGKEKLKVDNDSQRSTRLSRDPRVQLVLRQANHLNQKTSDQRRFTEQSMPRNRVEALQILKRRR